MNPNEPNPQQLPPIPAAQPVLPQQNGVEQYNTVQPFQAVTTTASHSGHSPYEFIMAPAPKLKQPLLGSKNTAPKLLLIVAGIGILVVVLGVIVANLVPKNSSVKDLTTVAQEQQELVRVAAQGERMAATETTKNLAYNVDMSIGTNQTQLLKYLTDHGTKLSTKQLALKQDATTDTTLTAAQASSTFDSALQKIFVQQLQTYLSDVRKTHDSSTSVTLRSVLSTSYTSGKLLLGQVQALQTQTQ